MDELGVGLTKNEEKAFVKELHSEFKSVLDGFVDSTHAPVQKFAKTYSDKFTNLFADIAQDVSAANKLLTLSRVKPQQGESLWNAAHRSFQSKGHSGTNDLGRILDKAVEAKFNAAVDKSSGSIYTSGKGRSRSQDERIGQDRNYIQSKHAELSQQKTGSAFTSPRKMSKNPKDLSFFDYETVGVMGYNDFAITEVAVKRAGQQVQTAFLQLTDDAADAIIKNIETIRTKGVGALGKNADHKQRAIARMLDYSLTDNNTITAMHKNLEGVDLVNEELLSRAETMAKIFKTGQGHDGVQVKNLQMGESGKRGYAMHEKFLNNFLGDSARAGHNIRGYDNAVNKAYGVAGTRDIDTL
jgi:hypothetical protein